MHCTHDNPRRRESGQALIIVLAILGLATGMFVYSAVSNVSRANANANTNALKMAEVKAALIAWAASRGDTVGNARPGELPCPDVNNDGSDNDGNCSAGRVGRVPWKTLGIPEPKGASGETLWYAVAGSFRRYNASTTPITSDTQGNMTVYSGSTATTLTSKAIAVIFAPGNVLGSQLRDTTSAACSTTGTTIARNLCAANYLETSGTTNNATNNGPFISAPSSDTFNDSVLAITNEDLMPVVERRVANEMLAILAAYKAAVGVYPWADLADGNSNGSGGNYYNHPRFPCGTALPTNWGNGGTVALPLWLTNGCAALTGWNGVIYYAAAKNRLESAGVNCTTCTGNSLTVDGVSSTDLLLITPGGYTGSPVRSWPTTFSAITGYFEDNENANNTQNDNTFVTPTATTYNRDRIFKYP